MRSHARSINFVGIVKCLCGRQNCTSIFGKSCRHTIGNRLKVGLVRKGCGDEVVVKKSVFSSVNALISTKIHSYSKPIYFAINEYKFQYPPHHLKI